MKYSIVITSRTEYLQKWLELYLVSRINILSVIGG
jgi:hypothetical protein